MSIASDGLRLVRASERVGAIMAPLSCLANMMSDILEIAPELDPEIRAAQDNMIQAAEHLSAAAGVLNAKAELL